MNENTDRDAKPRERAAQANQRGKTCLLSSILFVLALPTARSFTGRVPVPGINTMSGQDYLHALYLPQTSPDLLSWNTSLLASVAQLDASDYADGGHAAPVRAHCRSKSKIATM